jgi:hypothetical protein
MNEIVEYATRSTIEAEAGKPTLEQSASPAAALHFLELGRRQKYQIKRCHAASARG